MRNILFIALILLAAGCDDLLDENLTVAERLEGRWKVEDSELKSAADWYEVDIYISSIDSTNITIDNFHNLDGSIYAQIVGMTIQVATQEFSNGWTIRGSATISNNYSVMQWSYDLDDGSGIWTDYTATYTKVADY